MTSPGKHLVPATIATSTIFIIFTAPLALFGSQPIDVQLQGEHIFEGQLKQVAAPYCGLAGLLSLGAGLASLAVTGWRQAARESEECEQQLAEIERQLKQKESLLQEALLSKEYLEQSGLSAFLEGELSVRNSTRIPQADSGAQPASAQPSDEAISAWRNSEGTAQIQDLHAQLQQILTQIEGLQTGLQVQERPNAAQAMSPDAEGESLAELKQRLRSLDPSWSMQQI